MLEASVKRYGLSMVLAINNRGLVRFQFIEGAMTADLMIKFMEHLLEDNGSKVFLIVDNLKVHHAEVVSAWLSESKARIEIFFFLPTCLRLILTSI